MDRVVMSATRLRSRRINDVPAITQRVEAEYREMPGLSVTLPQAQRLLGLDRQTCEQVFARLVARGALTMTPGGRFVRA